jgi:hypothetical protein
MKNRLVLLVIREHLPDKSPHWVVVATYDNIGKAIKHYESIASGKMMFIWDMFYGVEIDRIDWDDLKCGGKIDSIRLPFHALKIEGRTEIYVAIYQAIMEYVNT